MKRLADLLFLAGCAAFLTGAWLVTPALALTLGGVLLVGIAFVIYPRRPEVREE